MTNLIAASFIVLLVLLISAITVDRGIPASLESLAFAIDGACVWVRNTSMRGLCGLADRMRKRRDLIEAENAKRRAEMEVTG